MASRKFKVLWNGPSKNVARGFRDAMARQLVKSKQTEEWCVALEWDPHTNEWVVWLKQR